MVSYAKMYCDDHDKLLELGALSDEELAAFSSLIDHRSSLPVFRGDVWRCYVCGFERTSIVAMANHIVEAHEPAPFNDEDLME